MNLKRPKPSEPFLDARGMVTRPWFNYLSDLSPAEANESIRAELDRLAIRVEEIAGRATGLSNDTRAYGQFSVQSNGTLAGGVVVFSLVADEQAPGNTRYYGTGPDGIKGWHPVADTLAVVDGEVAKEVGDDGVTTFGLADLPDAGGGTLQRFERDGKGRVSGTSDASIDDLSDVDAPAPADGDALVWRAADAAWKPGAVASGGNVDGGRADSIYLPTQRIDGGNA